MEYLLSFAQDMEDIILYHLLKNVNAPIRYVDVGANDPVDISVTKFFYDRGASGINIEPQKEIVNKLNKDRPRDINLAVGISNKTGELTLYGKAGLASFDHNNELATSQKIEYTVPVVTLSEIFNKYVSKDEDIHFLKIDVEGWERQCLEGMNFLQFRPWILCIESTLPSTGIPCYENWEEIVLEQNYVFLGDSGINRYYAAPERLHELQEFCPVQELQTIYRVLLYSKYITDNPPRRSILRRIRDAIVPVFNRTSVGRKVKTSIKKSFLWQKVIHKRLWPED